MGGYDSLGSSSSSVCMLYTRTEERELLRLGGVPYLDCFVELGGCNGNRNGNLVWFLR